MHVDAPSHNISDAPWSNPWLPHMEVRTFHKMALILTDTSERLLSLSQLVDEVTESPRPSDVPTVEQSWDLNLCLHTGVAVMCPLG